MTKFITIVLLLCGLAALSACHPVENTPAASTEAPTTAVPSEAPATDVPSSPQTTAPADMSDPFAYCASVGAIDQPDDLYSGEAKPESVIKGLMKASGASTDIPLDVFTQGSFWRCMDGKVYGCFIGANLPCDSKADTSNASTAEMNAYCQSNPSAESVPAAVTGHATIYEWKCQDGKAIAGDQVFQVDAQGFISEIWYAVEP